MSCDRFKRFGVACALWASGAVFAQVLPGGGGGFSTGGAGNGATSPSGFSTGADSWQGSNQPSADPGTGDTGADTTSSASGKGRRNGVPRIANAGSSDEGISRSSIAAGRGVRAPLAPNEFQKFLAEATGNKLPIFGADFFTSENGYSPRQGIPVPADYPFGPGDEVVIRGWGSVDVDYRVKVDRNGYITIPTVGKVLLAGVRAGSAEEVVSAAFRNVYRGFNLSVTVGELRGITVYVVGQARQPGTYTVSSLSTVISALFESGGPNANGSLRRVQVKRNGKQIAELDLYAFLSRGDKSADIHLLDGDVIVIPPALGFVALTGKVEAPAVYELRSAGDTIESLLAVAGGLPVVADPRKAFIERIDPARKPARSVEDVALDAAGLARTLKNGDVVSVLQIMPEFANAVTLRGAMRLPFREGMKVTDVIPNKEFLLSRSAIQRLNSATGAGGSIGNRYDEISWDYAIIERLDRASLTESIVSFNLGRALTDPASPDNVPLQAGDTITVFSADDVRVPVAKRRVLVRLEGEVRRPGVYQVEPGESLINMLERAGGLTSDAYLFGTEFTRESVRKAQQENLEKFIRKLEQQGASEAARIAANRITTSDAVSAATTQASVAAEAESRQRFLQRMRELKSTGRVALGLAGKESSMGQLPALRLENGDRLLVPSRPDFVQVVGAVNTESALIWQPGRSVSDYLALAGLGKDSDKSAIFVIRANGTVISNDGRWITSIAGSEVLPGDVIVLPEKADKESFWTAFWRNTKDITQILSNIGLTAAAIHTLSLR